MQTEQINLPADHSERMNRALLSLDGLSIGDGFGDMFFTTTDSIERRLEYRDPPPAPWRVTDDTMMALSIVRSLKRRGHIDQDELATAFAQEYIRDPRACPGKLWRVRPSGDKAHAETAVQ